jgi:hypothetical protein
MTTPQSITGQDDATPPVACTLGSSDLAAQAGRWEQLIARAMGAAVLQPPQPVGHRRAGQPDPPGELRDPQPRRRLEFRHDPPVHGVQRRFRDFEGPPNEIPLF